MDIVSIINIKKTVKQTVIFNLKRFRYRNLDSLPKWNITDETGLEFELLFPKLFHSFYKKLNYTLRTNNLDDFNDRLVHFHIILTHSISYHLNFGYGPCLLLNKVILIGTFF